jgi:hypothetical protein
MKSVYLLWENRIDVYNKKDLPPGIEIDSILQKISSMLPISFLDNIDSVYVGEFESLRKREVDSVYQDGAIYIVPSYVFSQEELLRNLVHEIAHAVEEHNSLEIYGDRVIEDEFVKKRLKLLDKLKSIGYDVPSIELFTDSEYSSELDNYFYKEIGYPLMTQLTNNMFSSPYGATSLREYFANSFEDYFLGNMKDVKVISPKVYSKINQLVRNSEEETYGNF